MPSHPAIEWHTQKENLQDELQMYDIWWLIEVYDRLCSINIHKLKQPQTTHPSNIPREDFKPTDLVHTPSSPRMRTRSDPSYIII